MNDLYGIDEYLQRFPGSYSKGQRVVKQIELNDTQYFERFLDANKIKIINIKVNNDNIFYLLEFTENCINNKWRN